MQNFDARNNKKRMLHLQSNMLVSKRLIHLEKKSIKFGYKIRFWLANTTVKLSNFIL